MRDEEAGEPTARPRRSGLAGYFAGMPANIHPEYVMVFSKGRVGYLPRENLNAAMQIDKDLKVLGEPQGL
jgi:hypothetical protein